MNHTLKGKLFGIVAGLGLLSLAPLAARADTRVFVDVGGYAPAPVVVAPAPYGYGYGPGVVRTDWERGNSERERWHHREWREHRRYEEHRWHEEHHRWHEHHDRDWR